MSTRSGKRIHNSPEAAISKTVVKTDRKTRSQNQKENFDVVSILPKKKHYVLRCPSEEDASEVCSEPVPRTRKSRRNLTEITANDENISKQNKTSGHKESNLEIENEEPQKLGKRSKKKKKKKNVQSTSNQSVENREIIEQSKGRRLLKKKTTSGSLVIEDIIDPKIMNYKSNISTESFHSAAGSANGSFACDLGKPVIKQTSSKEREVTQKKVSKKINENEINVAYRKNDIILERQSSKNKSKDDIITTKNIEERCLEMEIDTNASFENGIRSRTSFKNSTFNDIVIDNNETFDKITETEKERRSSLIIFDKEEKSKTINGSIKILNNSFDKTSNKRLDRKNISKKSKINGSLNVDKTDLNNTSLRKDSSQRNINTTYEKNPTAFDRHTNINMSQKDIELTSIKKSFTQTTPVNNVTTIIKTLRQSSGKTKSSAKINTDIRTSGRRTGKINLTFDEDAKRIDSPKKLDITTTIKNTSGSKVNTTFEKTDSTTFENFENINLTFEKDQTKTASIEIVRNINSTFETAGNVNTNIEKITKSDTTLEKVEEDKLNITFDKSDASKTSVLTSDASNMIDDKSVSYINLTSDDSMADSKGIENTTPVLIESSMDVSLAIKSPKSRKNEVNIIPKSPELLESPNQMVMDKTPPKLQREGTFTKDLQDCPAFPFPTFDRTPKASPGCTPFPASKRSSSKKILNLTRSIEKRKSLTEPKRTTRVMFCSPVNTPMILNQTKGKVIKSSMKGSNKSFVFNEDVSEAKSSRKRSYTQQTITDAEALNIKRQRLVTQPSGDQPPRGRTTSASGKLLKTPTKTTPVKPKPEIKLSRKKLPNFAALHQKEFDKMESLNECQERKAKRAKQMLATNTSAAKDKGLKDASKQAEKDLTIQSLNPGFTRFGFRMKIDVNPFTSRDSDANSSNLVTKNVAKASLSTFSALVKNDAKISLNTTSVNKNDSKINLYTTAVGSKIAKVKEINDLKRQATLPSLAGCTTRRELARQTIMREKSLADKRNVTRNENRTIIKGVRTNRRFELQMQMRNM